MSKPGDQFSKHPTKLEQKPGKKWYNKVVRLIARLVSKKTKNKQAATIEYRIFFPCSRAIVANFPRLIILDLIRSKGS